MHPKEEEKFPMNRFLWLALLVFLVAHPAPAEQGSGSWQDVKRLQIGRRVEVVDMRLRSVRGTLADVSDEAVSIQAGGDRLTIEREQVLRVTDRERSRRLRNTMLGLAIGAGAGLAIGAAADASFTEDDENIAKMLFTPIGAGIGAGLGAAFTGFHTVYRTDRRGEDPAPTRIAK